jgi:hypothetical protein
MKHSPLLCCLTAACLLPLPALAGKAGAHVHGTASLQVAIDGQTLTLNLETPLENLLGFEHAPRTDKQKAAVRAMSERLNQPGELFSPSPAAQCTSVSVALDSPVLKPATQAGRRWPCRPRRRIRLPLRRSRRPCVPGSRTFPALPQAAPARRPGRRSARTIGRPAVAAAEAPCLVSANHDGSGHRDRESALPLGGGRRFLPRHSRLRRRAPASGSSCTARVAAARAPCSGCSAACWCPNAAGSGCSAASCPDCSPRSATAFVPTTSVSSFSSSTSSPTSR